MSAWEATTNELQASTRGQVLSAGRGRFSRVSTDSRADLKDRLFIALKGDKFDAHDFVPQAVANGAACVLVHEFREAWKPLLTQADFVQVPDTLKGLQDFGRHWRRKHRFKVIGITGSNGKTSTKEFLYSLLKGKFATHASKGSYNNHWGVPLSILEAGPQQSHLVLEMGMSALGEIWRLCQIAEPDIVVVTTVGRAHIGELGSQAKVAEAKEEIYVACPSALHVFNMDNEWTMRMQPRSHSHQLRFSAFHPDYDVHLRAQRISWDGLDIIGHIQGQSGQTLVHVIGRHNVTNLMSAVTLALAAGMTPPEIWVGLSELHDSAWGRNQVLALENGARILFDAYNANPDSMTALMKNVFEMEVSGRKFLIVGDMKQQGEFAQAAHQELGEKAGHTGFEGIWYVGEYADAFEKGLQKSSTPSIFLKSADVTAELSAQFLDLLKNEDLIAIKGSRGMELERVLANWPLATPLGKKP